MLFKEIIAVWTDNHKKTHNTNEILPIVKAGGI
jgi:hypothetical protein